jgi:hypothetical protein
VIAALQLNEVNCGALSLGVKHPWGVRGPAITNANRSIGGRRSEPPCPMQPASRLDVLFFFKCQGVDIGGRYVTKH